MLKETVFKMSGNDQYEGFAIDIIHEISKMLGFNYTFYVQSDNVYGSLNPETGSWNGMLRKIIDNVNFSIQSDSTIHSLMSINSMMYFCKFYQKIGDDTVDSLVNKAYSKIFTGCT